LVAIPTTSPTRVTISTFLFPYLRNDKPVHLDNFLKWSKTGVKEGDLVFVSGHPGNTEALEDRISTTVSERRGLPGAPRQLQSRRIALFQKFAARSRPENARARESIFGYQNSPEGDHGHFRRTRAANFWNSAMRRL